MQVDLTGINPAHLVPFHEDNQEIHEEGLKNHLHHLAGVEGVNGIVCNGHAAEVHALTKNERERLVKIATEIVDDEMPVISGVVGGSTREVIDAAKRMKKAGADAILTLPPYTAVNGRAEIAQRFFERLSDIDIPIVLFQHPHWAGGAYDSEVLGKLVEIENVVAVKEAIWEMTRYQNDIDAIQSADSDIQILVADDEHLLPCYSLAGDGSILGLAAAIPELVVELFTAVQESNLKKARSVYNRMLPFVNVTYGKEPKLEGHTRLKVALELQGKLPSSVPREPSLALSNEERNEIASVMKSVDLL